ncbi:MAG: hypothetical protein ABIZ70_13460 [Gemmatimonadales bacterium]
MRAMHWILTVAALTAGCTGDRALAPISLEPMSVIGATEGAGTMATWPRVSAHHPAGYRVLVPQPGGVASLPLAYSDSGAFLGPLGTSGDSADGFREPLFARIGLGDSLWLFDNAQRALVFSPARSWVRTVQLPIGPWDAEVGMDGRVLLASSSSERPFPLLLLAPDGAIAKQIAGDSAALAIHSPRRLVRAPDGSWWTMPMQFRYRLEHWDSTGTLLGVIDRQPDWFAPYSTASAPSNTTPPSPMLMDAWFDAAGRLWVLGKAADPKWSAGLSATGSDSTASPSISDADKVYDTVLDVLDPASGALLATTRFDVSYPFAVEPGVVMRVRRTGNGWNQAELMRVVFDTTRLKRGK